MEYLIAFIAPFNILGQLFQEVCQDLNKEALIVIGSLQTGARWAVELEEQGVDVIISRGGTTIAINKAVNDIPVVDVQVSFYDLIRAIEEAKKITNKIAVVAFEPFTQGLEGLGNMFDLDLKILTIDDKIYQQPEYIENKLKAVKDSGYNCVVGSSISVKTARKLGMTGFLINSGRDSLIRALLEAEKVAIARRKEKEKTNRIKCIIDSVQEGIISINQDGLINIFNPGAEKIFNRKAQLVLGKDINQIFPELKVVDIKQIGYKEYIVNVGGRKVAMQIVPIEVENQVMGFVATCQKVSDIQKIEQKIRQELYLKGHIAENNFSDIIGQSREIQKTIGEARDFAADDSPLLIYGETGTGKELFAQAIHNASPRSNKPFVAFNCAALPENLLESELFGYVNGAFTGARSKGKAGFFEMAHEGTIFLDEIGEISLNIQVRLLRVIEESKVRRLGDDKITPIDVRIILATNKDLQQLVSDKIFREDLFYRINVLNLYLPPLRERKSDIPLLVKYLIQKHNQAKNNMIDISEEGMEILENHEWPGNIRQLDNIVKRLVIRSKGRLNITPDLIRETIQSIQGEKSGLDPVPGQESAVSNSTLQEFETSLIARVLQEEKGNKTAAAKRLGISRTTIWRRLNDS